MKLTKKVRFLHLFFLATIMYDPEGPLAKQLTPLLVNELTSKYGIPDDAQDVAEYINVLIGNNRSAADICSEVKEVVNIPIDEAFVGAVFAEIGRLEGINQAQAQEQISQPVAAPQVQQTQPMQQQQVEPAQLPAQAPPLFPVQLNPFTQAQFTLAHAFAAQAFQPQGTFETQPQEDKEMHVDFQKLGPEFRKTLPAGPRGKKAGGVGKDFTAKTKKSFGIANAANLERALDLSAGAQSIPSNFVARAPKGRCRDFPHCKLGRDCKFSHPTKKCNAYPNCRNAPGTCDYLHPSEDGELMEELDKTRKEYLERRSRVDRPATRFQQPQVMSCKYGVLCSKELCPFGHPTPANTDAKIFIQNWCRENKSCTNTECKYAHSSPNYQAPARAPVQAVSTRPNYNSKPAPTSLEQCKFGWSCTNKLCARRHATSYTPCRFGAECTRLDCSYNHPIDEDCRFGDSCKNNPCYFRHPDGREKAQFSGATTSARSFAVPEDQIMEQAVQE